MDKNTAPDRHIDAHSKPSTLASNLPGALPGAAKSPFTRRVLHAPPGYRAGLSAETNSHHLGPSPRERRFLAHCSHSTHRNVPVLLVQSAACG